MKNKFNIFITIILLCISCIKNFTEGIYIGSSIPDISKSGDKIIASAFRHGEEDLFIMNANGSNKIFLTSEYNQNRHPQFSPNDKYIVYDACVGINNYDIFRMELNGKNNINLTRSNGFCVQPIIQ